MLTKRVIPCLDIDNGRVVKGVNFVDLIDAGDPVEIAKMYNKALADEIIFLDITASYEDRSIMLDIISKAANEVFIPLTVGGGIKSVDDFKQILNAGADKISINSSAIKTPCLITDASLKFGSQCVVVAIDAKKNDSGNYDVYINGGRINTGKDALLWAKEVEKLGAGEILLTSMDRDGTRDGYELTLTNLISSNVSIPVIASGGVGNVKHLIEGITIGNADAVLAASIFHFNEITIRDAKSQMRDAGISVRL